MDEGWEEPPGYPLGMQQKVLTSDLDEENKTGSRSRFLRLLPGVYSTAPFIHDHWEEVYFRRVTLSSVMTSMGMAEKNSMRRHMPVARRAFTTALQIRRWVCDVRAALLLHAGERRKISGDSFCRFPASAACISWIACSL